MVGLRLHGQIFAPAISVFTASMRIMQEIEKNGNSVAVCQVIAQSQQRIAGLYYANPAYIDFSVCEHSKHILILKIRMLKIPRLWLWLLFRLLSPLAFLWLWQPIASCVFSIEYR
jgi:hypothetical protein